MATHISDLMFYQVCSAFWSYIRLDLPGGSKCRELEMLREHLRNVLLILGVGFSTHWVTKVWTGLTIVLKAHGDGLEMASLQNVLLMTDIGPDSIGVPPGARSFWSLASAPNRGHLLKVNSLCRTLIVNLSYGLPSEDPTNQADEIFGELDSFLGNTALGLNQ